MIAYLEGRLVEVSTSGVILITDGGVGYDVEVSARTRQGLPEKGKRVSFYTYLVVREDSLRLCGFLSYEERETFEVLLSIPKVGPRLALGILSVFKPVELRQIVAVGDSTALTQVAGIGKRTAESIFRELAYKLKSGETDAADVFAGMDNPGGIFRDVLNGLCGLGFTESECSGIIRDILHNQPALDVPGALRMALMALNRKKG